MPEKKDTPGAEIKRPCPHCGKETAPGDHAPGLQLDPARVEDHPDGSVTFACPHCDQAVKADATRRKVSKGKWGEGKPAFKKEDKEDKA